MNKEFISTHSTIKGASPCEAEANSTSQALPGASFLGLLWRSQVVYVGYVQPGHPNTMVLALNFRMCVERRKFYHCTGCFHHEPDIYLESPKTFFFASLSCLIFVFARKNALSEMRTQKRVQSESSSGPLRCGRLKTPFGRPKKVAGQCLRRI